MLGARRAEDFLLEVGDAGVELGVPHVATRRLASNETMSAELVDDFLVMLPMLVSFIALVIVSWVRGGDCFGGVEGQGRWAVSEKPRHVFREAGLIISSDLCPVTPGSCTRLSTSLQFVCDVSGLANR